MRVRVREREGSRERQSDRIVLVILTQTES
jgi:hypothetical protein